jgi:hypothetical protein
MKLIITQGLYILYTPTLQCSLTTSQRENSSDIGRNGRFEELNKAEAEPRAKKKEEMKTLRKKIKNKRLEGDSQKGQFTGHYLECM